MFGFLLEDCYVIEELIAGLHKVLKRKSITPRQIVSLGKLLHGLKRLPLATSGIDITVSIEHRSSDGNLSYRSLRLSEDSGSSNGAGWLIRVRGSGINMELLTCKPVGSDREVRQAGLSE